MRCRNIASLALVAAALVAGPALAFAEKQATVAVLGLEVIDDGAGIDAKIAKLATDLTDALRRRASVGAGPFTLAPNSNKDLLEMKLLSGCGNEARSCMAGIGRELGAERLMYGKIERRKDGYQVTLKLLNVGSKSMERSTTELIRLDDTTPARITFWSQKLYNRLVGVPDQGALTVEANVGTARIYIDNELRGTTVNGKTRIEGLAPGPHRLRAEAEGHETLEDIEVTIEAGKTAGATLQLRPADGDRDSSEERPGSGYRVAFWSTAVLTAAGATAFTITGLSVRSLEEEKIKAIQGSGVALSEADACADAESKGAQAVVDACEKGKSRATLTNILVGASVATALAAGYFYYKGYVEAGASAKGKDLARGKKRRDKSVVKVAPALAPGYVGAGIAIEF